MKSVDCESVRFTRYSVSCKSNQGTGTLTKTGRFQVDKPGMSKSSCVHRLFPLQVIAFQEKNTPEICGCSSPSGLMSAAPTTEPNGPYPQHSLAPGGRRGSHDSTAKLSPIDASMFRCEVAGKELQSKTPTKSQGSSAVARGGAEGKKGRNGGATGHHLHSIVDEARAEVAFWPMSHYANDKRVKPIFLLHFCVSQDMVPLH